MNSLAILDRDGVLNRERGDHTWTEEDFEVLPTVATCISELSKQGYAIAVISNQSGIGLGKYDHDHVTKLFDKLDGIWKEIGVEGVLNLYCPHHPSNGKCLCRKPGSLLIERTLDHFSVNASNAFFVGDRERDVQAAENAGVEGLLIESNADLHTFLINQGKLSG